MEAKDFWCYFWGTRYCYLVVFAEKALNPQYPCGFSPFCALVVFHRGFDWRPGLELPLASLFCDGFANCQTAKGEISPRMVVFEEVVFC